MAIKDSNIDAGYAWLILVACVMITCFEYAATTGIFYMAILEKYQRDHYSTIWIQTLQVGMLQFSGLFAGAIIEKKGYMFITILAGVIYTLSF